MKELAIKGHKTRGNEVIELLKMLGGRIDVEDLPFDNDNFVLYIGNNKCVYPSTVSSFKGAIYSLEEFEAKFPYKVGDKVWLHYENSTVRITEIITHMRWCNKWNCILYDVYTCNNLRESAFTPYKEETITIDDFKANTKEWLIDKLESMSKENTLQTISNLYDELHKPKYPKTYAECCGVIGFGGIIGFTGLADEEEDLYAKFIILKRCRDAYWKIVGEEMGLGKPWEPDWNNDKVKYGIVVEKYVIEKRNFCNLQVTFSFPTEEMRDAFYENFKDLIERCKELI